MLLSISTQHQPATDLGYLLHKHPERFQSFDLSFGQAHLFYTESNPQTCTACLLLDVDSVDMVRGKLRDQSFLLGHYVNDRPYVASSFMSVAIAQVLGSAMGGRCKDRPELASTPIPLVARIDVLPARGGGDLIFKIFEPLGYEVIADELPLDDRFPAWGKSPFYSVTIRKTCRLAELLSHLYVLIPVFDNDKHYFVGEDELEKLLDKGEGWLAQHPEKEQITRRYLRNRTSLFREALARLVDQEQVVTDESAATFEPEEPLELPLSLHERRHETVVATLKASGARRVLDLGCGEGRLLRELLKDRQFEQIVGMDVSIRALELAHKRLKVDRLSERQLERLSLMHGSLMYRDKRLAGFDAAALVEVIEHLDAPRLSALERVVFQYARPKLVIVTTPNREYNIKWETLPAGEFRHPDHRFEWTREEFGSWADRIAAEHGYTVRHQSIGPEDEQLGAPTQMAVFSLTAADVVR